MRIQMQRKGNSIWTFLVMAFTAVALAAVALPGCGDDTTDSDSDTESDSASDSASDSGPPDSPV